MPRRHTSRDRPAPAPLRRPAGLAPAWALADGMVVRESSKPGSYVCPGCNQAIRPGSHLVVWPEGEEDRRKHWHSPCWQRELRRLG